MSKIINPLNIEQNDLPLIVFVDDRKGFFSWAIKAHTHGVYNHVMIMIRPGYFASQNPPGFKSIPMQKYMKRRHYLKFWQPKDITEEKKEEIFKSVKSDLETGGFKRRYDFLGIFGQWLSSITRLRFFRKINDPWASYCSERVAKYLRLIPIKIPLHPSPSDLNKLFKKTSEMVLFGYWSSD